MNFTKLNLELSAVAHTNSTGCKLVANCKKKTFFGTAFQCNCYGCTKVCSMNFSIFKLLKLKNGSSSRIALYTKAQKK